MLQFIISIVWGGLLLLTGTYTPLKGLLSPRYEPVFTTDFDCLTTSTIVSLPADDLGPVWSPDNRSMAFVAHADGNPEIYLAEWQDNSPFPLLRNLSDSPEDDYNPLWSPNNRYVSWLHREAQNTWRPIEIRVFDLQTGSLHIAAPGYETRWILGWSADSQSLVYRQDNAFYSYDMAAREQRLFHTVNEERTSVFWHTASSLSPDGRWLVESSRNAESRAEANIVNIETGESRTISIPDMGYVYFSAWSKDSQYIALTNTYETYGAGSLWLLDVPTGETTLLYAYEAPERLTSVDWSANGALAWVIEDGAVIPSSTIFITDAQSKDTRSLLSLMDTIEQVSWSPTDSHILAFHTFAGLYVAEARMGAFSELVQGIGKLLDFRWSPNGDAIAAQVNNQWSYPYGIALVDLDSHNLFFYSGAAVGSWSSDGKRLTVDYPPNQPAGEDVLSIDFCDWNQR